MARVHPPPPPSRARRHPPGHLTHHSLHPCVRVPAPAGGSQPPPCVPVKGVNARVVFQPPARKPSTGHPPSNVTARGPPAPQGEGPTAEARSEATGAPRGAPRAVSSGLRAWVWAGGGVGGEVCRRGALRARARPLCVHSHRPVSPLPFTVLWLRRPGRHRRVPGRAGDSCGHRFLLQRRPAPVGGRGGCGGGGGGAAGARPSGWWSGGAQGTHLHPGGALMRGGVRAHVRARVDVCV